MPVIKPNTPAANAFQDAIQKQLAQLGYSTDDDTVMAEYCVVMLGNSKTKDQITSELSELVGSDFDPSFVDWLFTEMDRQYSEAASQAETGSPDRRRTAQNNDRPIFGQAMSGVKRGAQDDHQSSSQPPHQRQRQDGPGGSLPTGPRNHNDNNRGGDRRRSGRGGPDGERSIFDRVTPRNTRGDGRHNNNGQFNDPIAATIEAVNRGQQPPGVLASIPFPVLMSHPASKFLNPQALAQAQAAAMAQAQAFAAMSGAFNNNGRPGGPPQGFGNGGPMMPGFGGGPPGMKQQRPMGPLPSKPQSESLCKAGVECKKPDCRYSHPSPVATKESGLVLSSEACEKQLECADPDCPKSHVSPAQKNIPPQQRQQQQQQQQSPQPFAQPPQVDPSTIAGAGAKPCKFGANCQRPGCVFVHPWDTQSNVPCRFGENCARPDCRFAHPGRRGAGGSAPPKYDRSKFSATFNNPSSTTATNTTTTAGTPSTTATDGKATSTDAIGEKPKEDETDVSERLKRFASSVADTTADSGNTSGDHVEISLETSPPPAQQ